jgi:hypothetical protein
MSGFFIKSDVNPGIGFASQAAQASKQRIGVPSASAQRAQTVFVDVAQAPTRADISRAGFAVGEVAVNPDLIASFLDDLQVVRTKVVSQSLVPGTAVARGTAIDVVIANPSTIPVHVIPGVHTAFQDLTMAQLNDQFADNTAVRDIVRHTTSAADLTTAQRETLTNALQQAQVPVDAENTVDSAFAGIQAAFTFMG